MMNDIFGKITCLEKLMKQNILLYEYIRLEGISELSLRTK